MCPKILLILSLFMGVVVTFMEKAVKHFFKVMILRDFLNLKH